MMTPCGVHIGVHMSAAQEAMVVMKVSCGQKTLRRGALFGSAQGPGART